MGTRSGPVLLCSVAFSLWLSIPNAALPQTPDQASASQALSVPAVVAAVRPSVVTIVTSGVP